MEKNKFEVDLIEQVIERIVRTDCHYYVDSVTIDLTKMSWNPPSVKIKFGRWIEPPAPKGKQNVETE